MDDSLPLNSWKIDGDVADRRDDLDDDVVEVPVVVDTGNPG